MRRQVGLGTVPAAAATGQAMKTSLRFSAMSPYGLPGLRSKPEMTPPALCLVRGFPTARLPSTAEGKPGLQTPFLRPRHVAGERLATDKTASRLYGVAKCSLPDRDPPQDGEREEAESGVLPT
jgi:hypothetical protein